MHSPSRTFPAVAAAVTTLALAFAACGGGGDKTYKEGTPAATGQAPDCSVAPLDLVKQTLKIDVVGPVAEPKQAGGGWVCTYTYPRGNTTAVEQVQLNSNASEENFAITRDGYKNNNNKVNNIKGWGDEAYATTVHFFSTSNNFAVRKGKVSVHITSTADYDNIKKLMKDILAKI